MKRPTKNSEGLYVIDDKEYKLLFGSRQQVMHETAYKTTGNLTKDDLVMNKWGRIVSAKKHTSAKKEKRLEKHGFFTKKGKFGYVKKSVRSRKTRNTRKSK